jgi:hypothetical protein
MIWVIVSIVIALVAIIGLVRHFKALADSDTFGNSGAEGWIFAILATIAFVLFRACRSGIF